MNPDLRQQLVSLHEQLGSTGPVDAESRALLITLLGDITRILEAAPQTSAPSENDNDLTERLDELAIRFEAEHPQLGTAIRRVVDALGKAGI